MPIKSAPTQTLYVHDSFDVEALAIRSSTTNSVIHRDESPHLSMIRQVCWKAIPAWCVAATTCSGTYSCNAWPASSGLSQLHCSIALCSSMLE